VPSGQVPVPAAYGVDAADSEPVAFLIRPAASKVFVTVRKDGYFTLANAPERS